MKRSPQREVLFHKVKDDLDCESPAMRLLCPTRWTVHGAALTNVSENYNVLRNTWCMAKQESSGSELRAGLGGVTKQMDAISFFFGVQLGRLVLNMADDLSATLESSYFSANEGQSLVQLIVTTLQSIRSEDSFTMFWKKVERTGQQCGVAEPTLRK